MFGTWTCDSDAYVLIAGGVMTMNEIYNSLYVLPFFLLALFL
jgi:hypothetical protein